MPLPEMNNRDLSLDEYRELADVLHYLRRFLSITRENAISAGLDAGDYAVLLALEGLPEGAPPTMSEVAAHMRVPRDSLIPIIDELVSSGEISRASAASGEPWLKLTRAGRDLLRRIAVSSSNELDKSGRELIRSLQSALKQCRRHCGALSGPLVPED